MQGFTLIRENDKQPEWQMIETYVDRRRHERIGIVKEIYLEVVQYGSRTEADNPIFRCETLDVSFSGLRLQVPEMIPPQTTVNIATSMGDWIENLELVGETKWVQSAGEDQGFWVGLELQETSRENMERWFKVVQSLKPRKA